jgi:hypothetical protein
MKNFRIEFTAPEVSLYYDNPDGTSTITSMATTDLLLVFGFLLVLLCLIVGVINLCIARTRKGNESP